MSSFGEELKRERELRQITLREISESTKINLRYLEALERNDFTHLPGGVFNKGFVRAFAEHIGVDAEAMVNAYLLEEKSQQEKRNEALSPEVFRPSQETSPPSSSDREGAASDGETEGIGTRRLVRIALMSVALGLLGVLLAFVVIQIGTGAGQPETEPEAAVAPEKGSLQEEPSLPEPEREEPALTETPAESPPAARASTGIPLGPAAKEEKKPPQAKPEPVRSPPPPRTRPRRAPGPEPTPMRLSLVRATQGRLNCDNRRIEILDGMAPGTEIVFHCRDRLLIDAMDGGALMLERGSSDPAPVGDDGVPVRGLRITPWPNPEPQRTDRE